MADYYVSSLASGGGSGTSGSPWQPTEIDSGASAGDTIYWKADGDYLVGSSISFSKALRHVGYTSVITDGGRPTIKATANSVTLISFGARGIWFQNFTFDANSHTGVSVGNTYAGGNGGCGLYNCRVLRCGLELSGAGAFAQRCYFLATAPGGNNPQVMDSVFDGDGSSLSTTWWMSRCVLFGGAYTGGNSEHRLDSVIVYGASGNGFNFYGGSAYGYARRCVAVGCGGKGFGEPASPSPNYGLYLEDCAAYGNTGGNFLAAGLPNQIRSVDLSGDPFTNAAGGDFSPNSTSGAGALLRALSFAFLEIATTTYADVGAVQHQDSGGGGGGSGGVSRARAVNATA